MQKLAVISTVALFLAGIGVAGAKPSTDCYTPVDESEIAAGLTVPLPEGRYLYLPKDEVSQNAVDKAQSKLGFWQETNKNDGLQTESCYMAGTVRIFKPDTYLGAAVP